MFDKKKTNCVSSNEIGLIKLNCFILLQMLEMGRRMRREGIRCNFPKAEEDKNTYTKRG